MIPVSRQGVERKQSGAGMAVPVFPGVCNPTDAADGKMPDLCGILSAIRVCSGGNHVVNRCTAAADNYLVVVTVDFGEHTGYGVHGNTDRSGGVCPTPAGVRLSIIGCLNRSHLGTMQQLAIAGVLQIAVQILGVIRRKGSQYQRGKQQYNHKKRRKQPFHMGYSLIVNFKTHAALQIIRRSSACIYLCLLYLKYATERVVQAQQDPGKKVLQSWDPPPFRISVFSISDTVKNVN